ncbi:MAG: class I SAM-dependent methyltransferase family protein [Candidatus Aenigmarchaeota archaeon]|nr:class I SAM-dependent methyltransferase family protein [Candidatus Aenigmarchaeota archaeon]
MARNSLKNLLEPYLDIEKIKMIPNSYDLIGHIAILEIPKELKSKKKLIAKALLEVNKNIKTVLEKSSERKGIFRKREYRFLAGEKKYTTVHREYGLQFKVNPTEVYFSPRELTERQRIAAQVKPKETVMVMFSGVGPYGLAIAKKQPLVNQVICIEMNPKAAKYARENIRLNRLYGKVVHLTGDVKKKSEKYFGRCDRIVMPLPEGGQKFLDIAVKCLKRRGGMIHFYTWGEEDKYFKDSKELLKKNMKGLRRYRIVKLKKVLPFSPRKWKVCIDAKIF